MSNPPNAPGMSDFEKGVLKYLKESNAGGEKVGFGAFSLSSKQKGNEGLAEALLEVKRAQTTDIFAGLNLVGKKLLKQVESLAENAITGTVSEQEASLKQLQVMKKLLPLIEDGSDAQKMSKLALKDFIKKSEMGMKKNTTAMNKFVGFAKGILPSAAGIAAGISGRSPLLGAVVNFALEKHQEKQNEIGEAEARNVQLMIDAFEEIAEAEAEQIRKEQERKSREKEDAKEKREEDIQESVEQIDEHSASMLATANASFLTLERIRAGLFGEDEFSEMISELQEGIRQGLVENLTELAEYSKQGFAEALAESQLVEALPSEEEKIEEAVRMEEQTEILRKMSDNVRLNNQILETQADEARSGGGILGKIKDSVLGYLGIGVAGGAAGGLLTKFGSFFKFLKGFGRMIPGAVFLKSALGKLFSFPVQFVLALINGARKGIDSFMSGAGFGTAALETLKGFANWFLVGFLDEIVKAVSLSNIVDPIFMRIKQVIDGVKYIFTGVWSAVQKLGETVIEFVEDPLGSVIKLKDNILAWFDAAVMSASDVMENPGAFFKTKFEEVKETMLKFFVSMIPDWIPTDVLPGSFKGIVQKYRYGEGSKSRQDSPVFADNIVDMFRGEDPKVERAVSQDPGAGSKASGGSSIIDGILRREGGFVNHKNDRGGATNFGITQQTLSDFLGKQSSVDDVRNLDEGTARQIYDKNYVQPFAGVKNKGIQEFLIDSGVNHGTGRAKQWQGETEGMEDEQAMKYLVDRRRKFYTDIVKNDPTQSVFMKGWMNRLAEFDKPEMYASKEAKIDSMAAVDRQLTAAEKKPTASGAPTMVANTVNQSNSSNSIVQKLAPVNPDPTFHRYAGAMA